MIARRSFIRSTSTLLLSATALEIARAQSSDVGVPNSVGIEAPKLKAPPNACDCHMHIYDPARFPFAPNPGDKRMPPANAAVPQYRLLQKRIGTTRVVIVTPRNYATDNRVTADALAQLGANSRGVAVLRPTVTDTELKKLQDAGVRGIRFALSDPAAAAVTSDMIAPLSKRVAGLGWHVQLSLTGEQIVTLADVLRRLPLQLVFDHMGRPPLPAGIQHPSHGIIRGLIDQGRAWVKLSGAYLNTAIGPPSYPESTKIARDFVKAAPERLLWGSDWPHPTQPDNNKPDDAVLFDLLSEWAPDPATRHRILVRNPESLYGFRPSA
jgi:predicted TIM-barrel fold metal-dependent hydrolase